MKERLFIFLGLGLLVALLVGLNAVTYVQKEKVPDSEARPNRSTYNTGPTGTRAFHDLLVSTGQKVKRWEKPVSDLVKESKNVNNNGEDYISTFVIVGKTRREIGADEIKQLLEWVDLGGRLVIIDRDPPFDLIESTAPWTIKQAGRGNGITPDEIALLLPTVDPTNPKQMTDGEAAAKPLQVASATYHVNAVQPSKFATSFLIQRKEIDSLVKAKVETITGETPPTGGGFGSGPPNEEFEISNSNTSGNFSNGSQNGPIVQPREDTTFETPSNTNGAFKIGDNEIKEAPVAVEGFETNTNTEPGIKAADGNGAADAVEEEEDYYEMNSPILLVGNEKKNLLVEFPHGYGTITVLSDPYVVSNGGVSLVDNSRLGLNIVSGYGTVVFDEYHQGYGSDKNRLLSYFTGTPVIPIFLQLLLLVGLIMFSKSRRFARPLPLVEPSRLSKLEYVAAMAQLKRRTSAFDLAVENIYTDFRRRVSRLIGVDNHHTQNSVLAETISKRTKYSAQEIEVLMKSCEDIMHGGPTNRKEVLALTQKLREIENALGLRRGRAAFKK